MTWSHLVLNMVGVLKYYIQRISDNNYFVDDPTWVKGFGTIYILYGWFGSKFLTWIKNDVLWSARLDSHKFFSSFNADDINLYYNSILQLQYLIWCVTADGQQANERETLKISFIFHIWHNTHVFFCIEFFFW